MGRAYLRARSLGFRFHTTDFHYKIVHFFILANARCNASQKMRRATWLFPFCAAHLIWATGELVAKATGEQAYAVS
jgi:hypothetical protein